MIPHCRKTVCAKKKTSQTLFLRVLVFQSYFVFASVQGSWHERRTENVGFKDVHTRAWVVQQFPVFSCPDPNFDAKIFQYSRMKSFHPITFSNFSQCFWCCCARRTDWFIPLQHPKVKSVKHRLETRGAESMTRTDIRRSAVPRVRNHSAYACLLSFTPPFHHSLSNLNAPKSVLETFPSFPNFNRFPRYLSAGTSDEWNV